MQRKGACFCLRSDIAKKQMSHWLQLQVRSQENEKSGLTPTGTDDTDDTAVSP